MIFGIFAEILSWYVSNIMFNYFHQVSIFDNFSLFCLMSAHNELGNVLVGCLVPAISEPLVDQGDVTGNKHMCCSGVKKKAWITSFRDFY